MVSAPKFPRHGFYYMVYPLGITDDTTRSILERFEFEVEKRMVWGTTEEIIIFSIGGNDTAILDINESRRNIMEIIKRAKRFSDEIAFLEIEPVEEKFTQPVPWDSRFYYNNKKIAKFNNLLNELAEKNNVKIIKLFEEWKKIDYFKLLADGVHPNDAGHKYIFEKVKNFLIKNYFKNSKIKNI
jgi:lysophospholipase L1-like esterase